MRYMLMIVQMLQNKLMYIFIERDMAQWLERDALTMLLPAIMFLPSQSWDIVSMLCP